MTSDTRLGVNPLSWVDPGASTDEKSSAMPAPAARIEAGGDRNDLVRIFGPVTSGSKEEDMADGKIKIKQTMETSQVAQHLKDLANSLESGTLRAEGGEKAVVLSIPENMDIEMKVSRKKNKAKLALELQWKDDGKRSEELKISDE